MDHIDIRAIGYSWYDASNNNMNIQDTHLLENTQICLENLDLVEDPLQLTQIFQDTLEGFRNHGTGESEIFAYWVSKNTTSDGEGALKVLLKLFSHAEHLKLSGHKNICSNDLLEDISWIASAAIDYFKKAHPDSQVFDKYIKNDNHFPLLNFDQLLWINNPLELDELVKEIAEHLPHNNQLQLASVNKKYFKIIAKPIWEKILRDQGIDFEPNWWDDDLCIRHRAMSKHSPNNQKQLENIGKDFFTNNKLLLNKIEFCINIYVYAITLFVRHHFLGGEADLIDLIYPLLVNLFIEQFIYKSVENDFDRASVKNDFMINILITVFSTLISAFPIYVIENFKVQDLIDPKNFVERNIKTGAITALSRFINSAIHQLRILETNEKVQKFVGYLLKEPNT